jgi:putative nucleotidyltransferase with HDIG domain
LSPASWEVSEAAANRKPRVLVADDDQRIVELLQVALSGNGFEVMAAFDGEEAWEVLTKGRPDLAILDVRMPRRTGFDLVEGMRGIQELAAVPVILISGAADTEMRLAGLMKGADDFMGKPFSPRELLLKCRRLLERTEALRGMQRGRHKTESEIEKNRLELARMGTSLRREVRLRDALLGLARELNSTLDPDRMMGTFVVTVMGQLGVGAGVLLMVDPLDPHSFIPRVTLGVPADRLRNLRFRVTSPLASMLLAEARPIRLQELDRDPGLRHDCGALQALGMALAAPVLSDRSLQGMLLLGERMGGSDFERDDLEVLGVLCGAAAVSLETAVLFREHEETTLAALSSLAEACESKDPASRGHTLRVAGFAVAIARALDLTPEEIESIRRGALLHDLGKTAVQDVILNKRGRLTEEEMAAMREHPTVGASVLRHLRFLSAPQEIVLHHNERVDGRGYPEGLSGEAFSLGARIVAVADSFDAMTTHRPYRSAMTVEDTLAVLQQNSGTQYDVAVVEALIAEVRAGRIQADESAERRAA